MAKNRFYEPGASGAPNAGSVRRSTRIAMGIFAVPALACEILLITGFRRDPHPLMYGIVITVMTLVFIGVGWGIHYIGKLAASEQMSAEDRKAKQDETEEARNEPDETER